MAVHVDPLFATKRYYESANKRWQNDQACHLTADSIDELHEFAARLGLRREWFQGHHTNPRLHHYDLTPNKRALAIRYGAREITFREEGERLLTGKTPDLPPAKCDGCRTPIWRWLNDQWTCLNCKLYDAIHLHKDDAERARIIAQIDATRPEKARAA